MKSSVQYCIKYYVWVWFWLQITVLRIFQHKKNIPNQELEQKPTESLAKVGIEYNLHSDLDSAKKNSTFFCFVFNKHQSFAVVVDVVVFNYEKSRETTSSWSSNIHETLRILFRSFFLLSYILESWFCILFRAFGFGKQKNRPTATVKDAWEWSGIERLLISTQMFKIYCVIYF